jgi:hypothetical protein
METREVAGEKPLYASRTFHFNWLSGVVIHAAWPFLPKHFREQPYAMPAVSAWFALGNIALRFATDTAVYLYRRKTPDEKSRQV